VSAAGRHERAVAQTLGFAHEAALRGDFADAIEWLKVIEVVDGVLPAGWQATRDLWLRGETAADGVPIRRLRVPAAASVRHGAGK
jgi:hypothetical protein